MVIFPPPEGLYRSEELSLLMTLICCKIVISELGCEDLYLYSYFFAANNSIWWTRDMLHWQVFEIPSLVENLPEFTIKPHHEFSIFFLLRYYKSPTWLHMCKYFLLNRISRIISRVNQTTMEIH